MNAALPPASVIGAGFGGKKNSLYEKDYPRSPVLLLFAPAGAVGGRRVDLLFFLLTPSNTFIMDNLKLPAYPLPIAKHDNGTLNTTLDVDTASCGFTKLELASLMIAQGTTQT